VSQAGALWAAEGTNFWVPFGQVKEQGVKVEATLLSLCLFNSLII
jgi:hypothetical protein